MQVTKGGSWVNKATENWSKCDVVVDSTEFMELNDLTPLAVFRALNQIADGYIAIARITNAPEMEREELKAVLLAARDAHPWAFM